MAQLKSPRLIDDPEQLPGPPLEHSLRIGRIDNHCRTEVRRSLDDDDNEVVEEIHTLTVEADAHLMVDDGTREGRSCFFNELTQDEQAILREAFRIITAAAK